VVNPYKKPSLKKPKRVLVWFSIKGGMGYWNKIRRDFPKTFNRMAKLERKMGVTILSDRRAGKKKTRLYLDQLEPGRGTYDEEPDIECGVLCKVDRERTL
jgi:hypothetical protein